MLNRGRFNVVEINENIARRPLPNFDGIFHFYTLSNPDSDMQYVFRPRSPIGISC